MSYRVTFYLPFPSSTITRHTYHNLTLTRAKTLAVRQHRKHRQHGPVMILDDVGEVVANDVMIELLAKRSQ